MDWPVNPLASQVPRLSAPASSSARAQGRKSYGCRCSRRHCSQLGQHWHLKLEDLTRLLHPRGRTTHPRQRGRLRPGHRCAPPAAGSLAVRPVQENLGDQHPTGRPPRRLEGDQCHPCPCPWASCLHHQPQPLGEASCRRRRLHQAHLMAEFLQQSAVKQSSHGRPESLPGRWVSPAMPLSDGWMSSCPLRVHRRRGA